jgi:hypothetical protein
MSPQNNPEIDFEVTAVLLSHNVPLASHAVLVRELTSLIRSENHGKERTFRLQSPLHGIDPTQNKTALEVNDEVQRGEQRTDPVEANAERVDDNSDIVDQTISESEFVSLSSLEGGKAGRHSHSEPFPTSHVSTVTGPQQPLASPVRPLSPEIVFVLEKYGVLLAASQVTFRLPLLRHSRPTD